MFHESVQFSFFCPRGFVGVMHFSESLGAFSSKDKIFHYVNNGVSEFLGLFAWTWLTFWVQPAFIIYCESPSFVRSLSYSSLHHSQVKGSADAKKGYCYCTASATSLFFISSPYLLTQKYGELNFCTQLGDDCMVTWFINVVFTYHRY